MSEKLKSDKLAAAKKRLKQFQAQSQGPSVSVTEVATPASQDAQNSHSLVTPQRPNPIQSKEISIAANGHTNATVPVPEVIYRQQPAELASQSSNAYLGLQSSIATQQERPNRDEHPGEMQQLRHQMAGAVANTGELQQQLQSHADTIAVLVGEKSNLAASLAKFQSLAREKIAEVEELQGRLNASRHRVQALQLDETAAREAAQKVEHAKQALYTELETAEDALKAKQRENDDLRDTVAELQELLSVRKEQQTEAQKLLEQTQYKLAVADQLRVDNADAGTEASLQSSQRRIEELELALDRLTAERDQSGEQYQAYVQKLTADNGRLAEQLNDYAEQNASLVAREASLVQHMGELERQMQQQIVRQSSKRSSEDVEAATLAITDKLAVVNAQNEELLQTNEKQARELRSLLEQHIAIEEHIAQLKEELEQAKSDQPDAKSLLETMHGDKLTASRAVTQNVQLKQQLDELQKAFVQLSNDKLELTERLQNEQYLGRENKFNADQRLEQMESVKEKLHFKDEEMIRLSHENEQRTKEVLQLTQQIDRLRHYESKAQSNAIVVQQAKETISRQKQQIDQLQQNGCQAEDAVLSASPEQNSHSTADTLDVGSEASETLTTIDTIASPAFEPDANDAVLFTHHIPTEEALVKLQERFTRTMTDIADLTEEKNRLEHVCTQLQGETETIGEYIALYQSQRQQLKQRELEKDAQMQTIVHDREEMRQKLVQLNALVERLIRTQHQPTQSDMIELATALPTDNTPAGIDANIAQLATTGEENTAVQILNLIGEIQDKNQNKKFYNQTLPEVHNCACCYGKLETV